jgi:small subunit ribosomal protein S21
MAYIMGLLEKPEPPNLNGGIVLASHQVGIGVKVRDKENIDRALRRFKRAVNRSRVLRMYRQNMSFTKPSEERRLAKEKASRNARKHNRRY